MNNIFETKTPVKPKVLAQERLYVYVPTATTTTKGIASYDSKDFNLASGIVRLKRNNPFETEALVKLNNKDFTNDNGTIRLSWPIAGQASSEAGNTNGYGLIKIKPDGYLKFDNGLLDADYTKFKTDLEENIKPIYGGKENGFNEYDEYVDGYGIARKDDSGNILLNLTKEAIGLNKVENKAFNEYVYDDLSNNVKTTIDNKLNLKLDKTTWNTLFNDWRQKNEQITTPHSWLEYLDAQQESIRDSLGTASLFLGFFETVDQLIAAHPADARYEKSTAYIVETKTYWAVRDIDGVYQWYDTFIDDTNFYDRMETDVNALRSDGLVPSVGSSGKWVQSDHVHPGDDRKLNKNVLQAMTLNITSTDVTGDDFVVKFWNKNNSGAYAENPITDLTVNIPYVNSAKYLHNWAGSINNFVNPENEMYWAGNADEFQDLDIDALPNGALIIVNDGENAEAGSYVTKSQLLYQGIDISGLSTDRFAVVDKNENLDGLMITGEKTANKIMLKGKKFAHPIYAGYDPMVVVTPQANGNTISEKYFEPDKLIRISDYGTPIETTYSANNVLRTSDSSNKVLAAGRLLVSGSNNTVQEFLTDTVENKLIATDGNNSIKVINLEVNKLMMTGLNGELSYFDMDTSQAGKVIGVSVHGTPTLLDQIEVPTSLPIKTFVENPSIPQASTVLVYADPNGVYTDGCLYMY